MLGLLVVGGLLCLYALRTLRDESRYTTRYATILGEIECL